MVVAGAVAAVVALEVVLALVVAVAALVFLFVLLALEGVVIEGVAERCAGVAQATYALALRESQLVDAHRLPGLVQRICVDIPCGAEVEIEALGEAQQY